MSEKLIYAQTSTGKHDGQLVPYVNLSEKGGKNVLLVRQTGGTCAQIELTDAELRDLALQIDGHLLFKDKPQPSAGTVQTYTPDPYIDFELPAKPACDLERPGSCESCQ